ncbi:MAG: hypothetical protein P4M01_13300 [Acidobacteriota bacterium]|nr:hypothetical protein [Acidobacteriota bacterium]
MFCDGCGIEVYPAQVFCSRCGKRLVPDAASVMPGRVSSNLQLLGILWIAFSALHMIVTLVGLTVGAAFVGHLMMPFRNGFLAPMVGAISVLFLMKSALGLAAGWGLMQRAPWARILAIILGFISLVHVPFGTALGIYTLVVLLPASAEREYDALSVRG